MRHAFVQLWLAPRDICALVATVQARDDLRRYLAASGDFAGSPLQGIAALRSVYKQHFSDCVAAQSPEELDLHRLVTIPRAAYHVLRHLDFCVFYDEDGNRRTLRDEAGRPVCATTVPSVETTSHPLMKPAQKSDKKPNTSGSPGPHGSEVPPSRFNPSRPRESSVPPSRFSPPTLVNRVEPPSRWFAPPAPGPILGQARHTGMDAYGRPLRPAAEDELLHADMQGAMKKLSEERAKIRGEKSAIESLRKVIADKQNTIRDSDVAHQKLEKLQQDIRRMEEELRQLQAKVLSVEQVRRIEEDIAVQSTDLDAHVAMEQALRNEISHLEEQQKQAVDAYERRRKALENMKNRRERSSWRWNSRIAF